MRSFISVSDRLFLAALLFSAATLASIFYYTAEGFSETMLMEKKNWRVDSLRIEAEKSEFALIGTSHATSHLMPKGTHYINLTGGHNLPPAMYYEAKALLKYRTSIRTAYIEADDHIFMNGPSYNVKTSSENSTEKNYMYENWHDFFDEQGKDYFGSPDGNSKSKAPISLQPDVKPILLKRITNKIYRNLNEKKQVASEESNDSVCAKKIDLIEPNIVNETFWSRLQGKERERALARRVGGFSLENPSPISPLMTEYYEKTIQLFLDRGIQVVLVRFPVSVDFQNLVHPENTMEIKKYLDNIQKKNNIPMLDISYLSKHGDKFFENEDHPHQDFFPIIGDLIINDFCNNRQRKSHP